MRAALPDVAVTASSALVREEREYERFSTAVVNAALLPVVRGYLERLAGGVRALGIGAPVFVMQSNGGTAALAFVAERPADAGRKRSGQRRHRGGGGRRAIGVANVLSFDMGGTTAKAGTISAASRRSRTNSKRPARRTAVARARAAATRCAFRSSIWPRSAPAAERSRGSMPSACCASVRSRRAPIRAPRVTAKALQPTVTDANVVLGRLNPVALVGGTFPIDAARSHAAVASVAAPLGGDVERTAAGIVALVDAEMAKVLRIVSVERGLDPRDFVLMAFGGGGPLHACALAADLGMRRVVIPRHPGLFSALGLLAADVRATFSRSLVAQLDAQALAAARTAAGALTARSARGAGASKVSPPSTIRIVGGTRRALRRASRSI